MKNIYKIYELSYSYKKSDYYNQFTTKKELNKFIKKLPKKLTSFSVSYKCFLFNIFSTTLISSKELTHKYIKNEIHEIILK